MEGPSGHSFLKVSHSGPLKAGKSMRKAKCIVGFDFLGLVLILSHRLIDTYTHIQTVMFLKGRKTYFYYLLTYFYLDGEEMIKEP